MAENKGKQPHTPMRGMTVQQRSDRKAKRHEKQVARFAARRKETAGKDKS